MNPNTGEIRQDFEDDPEFKVLPPNLQQMVRLRMNRTEAVSSTHEGSTVRSIVANLRNPQSPLAKWALEQRVEQLKVARDRKERKAKTRAKMAAQSKRRNRK